MTKRRFFSQAPATTAALLSLVFVEPRLDVAPRVLAQSARSAGAATDAAVLNAETFREIAKAIMPSVVNVRTESRSQTGDLSRFFGDEPFERFFGPPRQPAPGGRVTQGAGSGFIIDDDGTILTNNHVVAGATKITVALYADERGIEYDARVVGRDPLTDTALIELTETPGRDLPAARLGSSRTVNPDDWVMAIGNPYLSHTVTVGVISAIGRPFPVSEGRWQNLLQTDAAINPGNSGGPLRIGDSIPGSRRGGASGIRVRVSWKTVPGEPLSAHRPTSRVPSISYRTTPIDRP
jgi:S1-C subfamily serine protease